MGSHTWRLLCWSWSNSRQFHCSSCCILTHLLFQEILQLSCWLSWQSMQAQEHDGIGIGCTSQVDWNSCTKLSPPMTDPQKVLTDLHLKSIYFHMQPSAVQMQHTVTGKKHEKSCTTLRKMAEFFSKLESTLQFNPSHSSNRNNDSDHNNNSAHRGNSNNNNNHCHRGSNSNDNNGKCGCRNCDDRCSRKQASRWSSRSTCRLQVSFSSSWQKPQVEGLHVQSSIWSTPEVTCSACKSSGRFPTKERTWSSK